MTRTQHPDPDPDDDDNADHRPFPPDDEARDRVRALLDEPENDYVYSLVTAGQNEQAWYYLVVQEREHEGNTYLNERYAQLVKPGSDFDEDTFLTNGINRRVSTTTADLAMALAHTYARVNNIEARDGPLPDEPEVRGVGE